MEDLKPDEIELVGNWVRRPNGTMSYDDAELRIDWLVRNRLEEIAVDSSNWTTLYRDPRDGRFWEESHSQSGMHLGGPRRLDVVQIDDVAKRYNLSDRPSA